MLAEFGRFALRDHAPAVLLAEACQVAARGLEAARVGIWRAEPGDQLRLVAGAGWPRGQIGQVLRDGNDPPAEQALAATIPLADGAFGLIEATGGPADAGFLELLATSLGLALSRTGGAGQRGFLGTVVDASPDCIKVVEGDGRLTFMNANGRCAMEIEDFSAIAGADWASLWPAGARGQVRAAVEAARQGRPTRFEAFCPTAKGTPKWWDVSVAPIHTGPGPASLVSISRDISARVRAEQALEQALADKDLLAREIDHRVKNSLTMVASLLSMQERGAAPPEVKLALAAAVARIRSIARIHERLYLGADLQTVDFASYIQDLGRDVAASMAREDVDLAIQADPLTLPVETALPLGLAALELLTNALKHARREDARSSVALSARRAPGGLRLSVGDDGPGLPEGFDPMLSTGLGMRLVRSLVRQLGGRLEARNAGGGACFTVAVPLRRDERQQAA